MPQPLGQLKDDFQSELNVERFAGADARRIAGMDRTRDEAVRSPIATTVVGLRQVQDVENVEHFDPELRLYALRDRRVFDDREVDRFEARPKKLVPRGVPEGSRGVTVARGRTLLRKRARVNPLHAGFGPSRRLHNTGERITQEVRPILLIPGVAVVES